MYSSFAYSIGENDVIKEEMPWDLENDAVEYWETTAKMFW